MKYRDSDSQDDQDVIARAIQQPNCIEASISSDGDKVVVHVEREFAVEVIGETKVCVQVNPEGCKDDDWESDAEDEFDDLDPDFLYEFEDE